MMDRLLSYALGCAVALAVFGLAEVIHHTGHNPFVSAAVAASSPAPATERTGIGKAIR